MVPQITPEELRDELASANPPRLLDVREPDELEMSRLDDIVHITMDQIPDRLKGLDREAKWVVVCRSGQRSAAVTQYLLASGFQSVRNLESGMNGWAKKVDPRIRVY